MVPCPMPGTHHTVHYSEFSGESIRSHRAGTGLQGRCEPLTHCAGSASLTVFLLCSEQGRPEMVAVREVPLSTCIMAPLWVYLSGPFHPVRGIALLLLPPPPFLAYPFLLQKGPSSVVARTSLGCYAWNLALEEARTDRCLALYSLLVSRDLPALEEASG